MAINLDGDLFEPNAASSLTGSSEWIVDVMFGPVAVGLCALAVAFVGAMMLTGRWHLRLGFRVVLGCFVLLGAPMIATGLYSFESSAATELASASPPEPAFPRDLPPAEYNPYAQASVRDDR